MKSYITTMLLLIAAVFGVKAQVVTTEPTPLQEGSEDVVVYFHADQGNKGLINQPSTDPVYAHTGVLTNLSKSDSDWKYAPSKWGDNAPKYKLEYVSANLWKLNIGNIHSYYGVPEGEIVKKLCFVFRNEKCTKECKTASGGDIFVDVYQDGFVLDLTSNMTSKFITDAQKTITFTASTTSSADITITINGNEIGSAKGVTKLEKSYTFDNRGDYVVKATAVNGATTEEKELNLCYPDNSQAETYPGGTPVMGAVKNSDGSVTFCLAAPQKQNVILVPAWDNYKVMNKNVMKYQDYNGNRYFWVTINGLDADKQYPYYYIVDSSMSVGDPYARLILDPYNDKYITADVYDGLIPYPTDFVSDNVPLAVYCENINKFDWQIKNFKGVDKSNLIIYELLLRDFTGTEGKADANGTIKTAMEKLPYLKELGVNAIELMPIMEFNGNNSWGYNTNFYFAPDKAYGTPNQYKEFIDECHRNGMAVILDIVFNQSDGLHPWYQMYPISANPFYNARAPHDYSVLNDWNQDNALVQQQFKDVVKYWLEEYNVDGYRFDLVKGLGDNNSYGSGTEAYNSSRVARMKSLHSAMKEIKPDAYFINENLAQAKEENEMAADGQLNWANINYSACQYAMGYSEGSGLNRMYAPNDSRTWGSTVSYCESHDEERMAYKQDKYGDAGVKGNNSVSMRRIGSAAAQMILSPGAHMIWQFSEIGNAQTTKNSNGGNNTDPKIVNWSLLDKADNEGLYRNYSELIYLRNANPELFAQDASYSMSCNDGNWIGGRAIYASNGNKELICIINPNVSGDKTITANFKSTDNNDYKIVSKSYNTTPSFDASKSSVSVPANSYVVIVNNNVSNVENITDNSQSSTEVYGVRGAIGIVGQYETLAVYTIDGRLIATSKASQNSKIELAAGVYAVCIDNKTFKVAVR